MTPDLALEATIDKILANTDKEITSGTRSVFEKSLRRLDDSTKMLEEEYERIISDGNREADKISRQIIGSADLEARNKQLIAIEDAVIRVFSQALGGIAGAKRDKEYGNLIRTLLRETVEVMRTSNITIFTNDQDRAVVQSVLAEFPGVELSSDGIGCLGGVTARSQDGSMTFDNTIDARIKRLKPLIRKEIASKFGVGG